MKQIFGGYFMGSCMFFMGSFRSIALMPTHAHNKKQDMLAIRVAHVAHGSRTAREQRAIYPSMAIGC